MWGNGRAGTTSAAALGALAVLHATAYVWYAVLARPYAPREAILETGLAMAGPAAVLYASVRVVRDADLGAGGWTVLKRCLMGALGVAAVAVVYLASQSVQGVELSRPFVAVHVGGTVGAVGGLVAGFREVEIRRHIDRLERHEERFTFLNNTLRHHVLNSVQVIQGQSPSLGDDPAARAVREQCRRVADLVQNVGVLSAVTATDPECRPVDLSAAVTAELRVLRESHPDARVEADIPAGVHVEADQFLPSVPENLLDNAVTHNDRETPVVSVSVTECDDRVRLRVADNGPGLSPAERRRALRRRTNGDEGVGLYLVRTLVSRYGGTLAVADNDPRGAVFTAEFPAA
jgi:signal transduction histidine kinase